MELKKFDITKIQFKEDDKGCVIALIGRRGTRKPTLIKDIMFYNQSIPIGTVISESQSLESELNIIFFSKMVPKLFIHNEYNSGIVDNILKRQKIIIDENKKDPRSFTILDNCFYNINWKHDKHIRNMLINSRNWKNMLILSIPDPYIIPPILTNNIDYVFIFIESSRELRNKLYENYAIIIPDFEIFNKLMDKLIGWYDCLVIDNTVQSNKWEDHIYWYKTKELHEDYHLCDKEYWIE